MTKKDYILFATMFKNELDQIHSNMGVPSFGEVDVWKLYEEQTETLIEKTADLFANDNPNFNRQRFLIACGMENK